MSFSYYTDAVPSGDWSELYTIINGYDNSAPWCNHNQWETYASFSTPSGYYDGWFSGLGAGWTTPNLNGDYSISSSSTVFCNCVSGTLAAGGANETFSVDETTIEVIFGYRFAQPVPSQQIKHCYYAVCPPDSTECGSGFDDVVGINDTCPPGVISAFYVKRSWWRKQCSEIHHDHTLGNPCPG